MKFNLLWRYTSCLAVSRPRRWATTWQ